ncbi:hypothetical protein CUJ83_04835 [Methanocella sp. CWC-04]|uniref:Uncharacterized protein n=1 Tax=Methanooceanicella nereidis TaxID=2052831 RepID=A0AAP2RBK5_9EURY|nr:hypothetical protein [Methanocella sp. CWC-04]MCD1294323.1 hypothetical protein [Methanocella sp. CWC-04]
MKKLTKEDVLKGKEMRETVHVDAYDADVVIRPLTDGELSEVFSIIGSVPLKDDGTPDTGKVDVTKNFRALRLATSMGLVEPRLTVEEVADMKFGVPEFIGTKVLEVSGIVPGVSAKKKELK